VADEEDAHLRIVWPRGSEAATAVEPSGIVVEVEGDEVR
jgi:hypothetical protein